MNQLQHARDIAARFKDVYELSGDAFSDQHYEELVMLIEAGLDAALLERMERIADQLALLAKGIRHDAESASEMTSDRG